MAPYDNSAKLLKALGHPTRLAILDLLRAGEACVCHLEAALGYRQAYISQHLMVLRDAGLVGDRREGSNVYYHVTRPQVYAVLDAADQSAAAERAEQGLSWLDMAAPRLGNCACPHCNANGTL
jgi:DNA-binding transcriptional ArsR family regulator